MKEPAPSPFQLDPLEALEITSQGEPANDVDIKEGESLRRVFLFVPRREGESVHAITLLSNGKIDLSDIPEPYRRSLEMLGVKVSCAGVDVRVMPHEGERFLQALLAREGGSQGLRFATSPVKH